MKEILLNTGNPEKAVVSRLALANTEFEVRVINCEFPEIQADNVREIASHSARMASEKLGRPVVKTDSGLFITALNGFPGPYSSYAERVLGPMMILKLMQAVEDRRAYYQEALAYCEPGRQPVIFDAYTIGSIATAESGEHGIGFDRIFIFEGDSQTSANLSDNERVSRYNRKHWNLLIDYLMAKATNN